jgi:tetratricopeptide (TPR) repeat protein
VEVLTMGKIMKIFLIMLLSVPAIYAADAAAPATGAPAQVTSSANDAAALKYQAALKKKQETDRLNSTKTAAYKTAMAAMTRGLRAEKNGNFRNAFYEYSRVLKSRISYPQVYKRLAACYYSFANYEFAIKFYNKYLQYFPNDNTVRAYIPQLQAAMKARENKRLGQTNAGAEFKSPLSAVLFTHIGLIPPAVLYQGYGSYYARNRDQSWFPVSSTMSILGEFCVAGGAALQVNSKKMESIYDILYNVGGYLIASAFVFDYFSSPFIAVESAENFLYFCKNNEMKIEEKKLDYKDPAFTAVVSLLGGSVVPGAGHFFAGDSDTGFKILIVTPLLAGSTMITGAVLQGNPDPKMRSIGNYVLLSGIGIYGICRLVDMYGAIVHTDQVNEEYYKQLVCPNSPFVLKQKQPEKEPWLALLISLVPIPGSGNFYAENFWTAGTLCGAGLAGAITYFAADGSTVSGRYVKYGGLALLGLAKLYDIISAPGYTAIYNDVYTGRQERERTPVSAGKVSLAPSIMPDGLGMNIAYSF